MSERRWHPMLGEWVVTATHRQDRTFLPPPDYCPLCPTKPGGFPTEVPEEDYRFVVFDNKFPSMRQPAPEPAVAGHDLHPVAPADGVCEVVLYTPRHEGSLGALPVADIVRLVRVWTDRYEELGARPGMECVFIFENRGEAIGVTIHHPHGQIYAFPFVPPRIAREREQAARHLDRTGHCLMCDIVADERADGRRLVVEGEHFVAFIPFFARYPYETYLVSKQHRASLSELSGPEVLDLSRVLKDLLTRFDGLWQVPFPYMMVMHQAPTRDAAAPGDHLHIEFYPPMRTPQKLKYLAGCESGAGTYINDTLPEVKAEELRAVRVTP
ncbi:MAG: galactose-1-phosphate uridylyltransferase [Candidatus Sericytochromatia bacterium]|nr:galactose-1-phosphate uridylyltransferase [Candidatus Sericytochromatia bacterium]